MMLAPGRRFPRALILAFLFIALPGSAVSGKAPDICAKVPVIGEQYDLELFMAGKPAKRFERAKQLAGSLPQLAGLNPFDQMNQVIGWLAVTALLESAVSSAPEVPEDWEIELVKLYSQILAVEKGFDMFESAVAVLALQTGGAKHPTLELAHQLEKVVPHAQDAIRWLAERRLSASPSKKLRVHLLEALVEVNRRQARWKDMCMAAISLDDLEPKGKYKAFQVEAQFELGEIEKAEKNLSRAGKQLSAEVITRARKRGKLARAREKLRKEKKLASMAKVANCLLELDEAWRVEKEFPVKSIIEAAHPGLDEAYIRAIMDDGLQYERAWKFGSKARGKPPTPAFLSRRIGAGLMLVMSKFYAGGDKAFDPGLLAAIGNDLEAFRKTDAELSDLTVIYLEFMAFISGDMQDEKARNKLASRVLAFRRSYPGSLAGLQMAYLVAQLVKEGPDPWEEVNGYRRVMRGKQIPREFIPVYAGAALRKAIRERDPAALDAATSWVSSRLKSAPDSDLRLWLAHLLAVRGLISEEKSAGEYLQKAVNAYGEAISNWGNNPGQPAGQMGLCDALASVGTLIMQSGDLEQVRGLLDQAKLACAAHSPVIAFRAVLGLIDGEKELDGKTPRQVLVVAAQGLESHQAQIQAQLWLGTTAEASGNEKEARDCYKQAGEKVSSERKRGAVSALAPDLRSMVCFSGTFNMGAGYSDSSPFGLVIDVSVKTRMFLFPPAAVNEEKLGPFLTQDDEKKQGQ